MSRSRRIRTSQRRGTPALALTLAVLGSLTLAGVAGASSSLVGHASVSGQVAGTLSAAQLSTASDGVSQYGCQLDPGNNKSVILNFTSADLHINGRPAHAAYITLQAVVTRNGNSESLSPDDGGQNFVNDVGLIVRSAGKLYAWDSISGTVSSSSSGRSGTFDARLLPDGSPRLPHAGRTSATAPIHLKGTWMGCHPGTE